MAQPTPYDRVTNFQNDQALAPTNPYPAPLVDAECNAIKITTDELIQNLSLIQRDDGQLANGSVGNDQLAPEIALGFAQPEPWQTATAYEVGATVFQGNGFYFCETNHTSGVFDDDLTAGLWTLLADFTEITSEAVAAAEAAELAATAAADSATNAATSATTASDAAAAAAVANAFPWAYDTSTTMADPGVGDVRFNNASLASVTALALSAQASVTGNPDVSGWVVTWDDSSNPVKGQVIVRKNSAPQNFAVFTVSAVTDNSVWLQATVAYVTHSGSFASTDQLNVEFTRAGNQGASGAGTGDLLAANNLSELIPTAATVRTNLSTEALVAAGTTAQYYRGDKSWQTLDKTAVGLGNVDNTADTAKPISTLTQTALDAKLLKTGADTATGPVTFTNASGYGETALTYGATTNWNVLAAPMATLTLAGNTIMGAPTNVTPGRCYHIRIVQNTTSTVTWNAKYKFVGGIDPTMTAVAGAVDRYTFIGTTSDVLEEVGRAQGIA